jgi:hypothetical protein
MMGAMVSPLRGAAGNVEFFLHASIAPDGGSFPAEVTARSLVAAVQAANAAGERS